MDFTQYSSQFTTTYNVVGADQYVFSQISWGYFLGAVFQGTPADLSGGMTIALDGAAGTNIKVEVIDANNIRRIQRCVLTGAPANFTLDLGGSIDPTQIAMINFVYDNQRLPGLETGTVITEVGGGLYIDALTPAEQATRDSIIQDNLAYLLVGIDPLTRFPADNITTTTGFRSNYTQPTAIGFHLQVLGDIAANLVTYAGMPQAQAISEADAVIDSLIAAQTDWGWNGLLPWLVLMERSLLVCVLLQVQHMLLLTTQILRRALPALSVAWKEHLILATMQLLTP